MKRLLLTLILLSPFFCRSTSAASPPPNVLMIIVDDMNDWVGCLGGHPQVKTPHIDRLAKRGLLFTNAHVAAPVCNPSRVATLTGLRPSTTGIYGNETKWLEAMPDVPTLPQHFKTNGYHVAGGGKVNHHMPGFNRRTDWHDYFDQVFDSHYQDQLARGLDVKRFAWPAGFPLNRLEAVRTFSKPPQNPNEFDWGAFDTSDAEMGDGKMIEWAVKFLAQPPKEPFFLAAGIYRPHLPFYAPQKYFDLYPLDQIILPLIQADDCDDLPDDTLLCLYEAGEDIKVARFDLAWVMDGAEKANATVSDDSDGFAPIFDGQSLAGWHSLPVGSDADWAVRDGVIVGTGSQKRLCYLVWKDGQLADFELKLKYRLPAGGNTGVEIRGRPDASGRRPLIGYHADIGHAGIGDGILGAWDFHFAGREEPACPRGVRLVIDEEGRATRKAIEDPFVPADIRQREWNDVHVIAKGRNLQFFINGKLASEFTDNAKSGRLDSGGIGLQIHDKGMHVEFKDIRLKRL